MRELAKDPKLANEDWSRFLPTFKKKNVPRMVPRQTKLENEKRLKAAAASSNEGIDGNTVGKDKKKKSYTPFPPSQTPSKIDLQLDSGEYFLSEQQRKSQKMIEKQRKSSEKKEEKRIEREKVYVAPPIASKSKEEKEGSQSTKSSDMDVDALKKKFAKASKRKASDDTNLADYVDTSSTKEKKKKRKKERH